MEVDELITEIGTYPETWTIDRVDSVFDLIQGKQVSERNRIGDNQRPFLRTKNVFWNRLELAELDQMHFSAAEEVRYALLPGDLLLCEGGDVGRTAMWRGEVERCYIQNHLHRLRAFDGMVNPQYAVFWFCYAFNVGNLYIGRGNKTTIPNMSRSKLAELQIALPPLPEQERIAQVLSTVQEAIAQQERLVRTTTELKQALMQKLFTEGLRGEKQKETEIGMVPESWEVVKLEEFCQRPDGLIQTGPFGSQLHSHEYTSEGIPVVNPTHLSGNRINHEDVPRVPKEVADRLGRHYVQLGDILFARRGEIGRHGLVGKAEVGWLCGTGCFLVRANDPRLNNEYLSYFCSIKPVVDWLNSHAAGAIMPNLSTSVIANLPVGLPPLDEQRQIIEAFNALEQKLDQAEQKRTKLQDLFRTLLHELMTGKVRV